MRKRVPQQWRDVDALVQAAATGTESPVMLNHVSLHHTINRGAGGIPCRIVPYPDRNYANRAKPHLKVEGINRG